MMTLFGFLAGNLLWLTLALVCGLLASLMGFMQPSATPKVRIRVAIVMGSFWFLFLSGMKVCDYYLTYRPNYKMCHSEVALHHDWIMQGSSCYRPVKRAEYVKVTDTVLTKEDLQ